MRFIARKGQFACVLLTIILSVSFFTGVVFADDEPKTVINPTQCEALTMVAVQVSGNDHAVTLTGSQDSFQLNVYTPVMLHNVLTSVELLADATRSFCDRCAIGIEPNENRIKEHLDNSLKLVTALNPHIGYQKAAKISLTAYQEDLSLREAALELGFLTGEQFDLWVHQEEMTHPLRGYR